MPPRRKRAAPQTLVQKDAKVPASSAPVPPATASVTVPDATDHATLTKNILLQLTTSPLWNQDQVSAQLLLFENALPTNLFAKRALLELHQLASDKSSVFQTQQPAQRAVTLHTLQPARPKALFAHTPYQPLELFPKLPERGATVILESKDGSYDWLDEEAHVPNYATLPKIEDMSALHIFGGRALAATLSEATLCVVPPSLQKRLAPSALFLDICAPQTLAPCLQAMGLPWDADDAFALQRFQGANPSKITVVAQNVLAEAKMPFEAKPNHNYLLLDYSDLLVYENKLDGPRLGPKAAFRMDPEGALFPESIDLGNGILSTPRDPLPWRWRYCKMLVQCAEFSQQEVLHHLTHCHLVMEVVILATMSVFRHKDDNMLYRLLVPSFSRTLAVNKNARELLLPWIKRNLTPFSSDAVDKMIQDGYQQFNCEELNFETLLQNRGFDPDNLPPTYFFAMDGVRLWRALLVFVNQVLLSEPVASFLLQEWSDKIRAHVPSFPETLTQRNLPIVVAGFIFLATVVHSARNDPQYYFFGSGVTAPASLHTPIVSAEKAQTMTNDDFQALYFDSLPSVDQLQFQRDLVSILALQPPNDSSVWKCLDDYQAFIGAANFTTFHTFRDALQTIGEDMEERGAYTWLSPTRATRSVIR